MKRFNLNSTSGVVLGGAGMLLLALATPLAVMAATPDGSVPGPGPGWARHGAHDHRMRSPFFRALRQLKLTPEQRVSVRSILTTSRQQRAANAQSGRPDFAALQNPGDPNHALAVQSAQTRAAAWIQQRSQIEASIYNLLTPEQKAALPTVLTHMQAQTQQRRVRHEKGAAPPKSG
jgi:Spy/CpxP family protein refolding chaperone